MILDPLKIFVSLTYHVPFHFTFFVVIIIIIFDRLPEDKTVGSLGFTTVKLLPDGACQFTRGMGMSCVWSTERGFGERSWRYSMVVNDGVIEKMFVEGDSIVQNSDPDPFECTDADTMSAYLKSK